MAVDDTVDVRSDAAVVVAVLENDRDPAGELDRSTLRLASAPGSGTATISGERIRYTPRAGASGTDRFTYAIEIPGGTCTTAAVIVSVR